ncbi:tyrosine-protein kinase RYK-like [Lingula anatina]|uniref:receptor protein-tyrosine kinase n=1 Tax=Lingula anatina TaxID=7574 RepID=A0A1S3H8T5_LINAN|nr:tyrosine-protein kinase RYK-like [Lingula anatina]|eukprot:XP_013381539.1 tyrosine-protein kinase RYK-like [Lingula anatina]
MFYSLSIIVSNPRAMRLPETKNISREGGEVPTSLTPFAITLPCSGSMSVEVDVKIQMNVSIFSASNLTTIEIKRKKTCLKRDHLVLDPGGGDRGRSPEHHANYTILHSDTGKKSVPPASTNVFYIAVGVACTVILIIALVVAVVYLRTQKSANHTAMSDASSFQTLSQHGGNNTYLRPDTPNNASVASLPNMRRGLSPVNEVKPPDVYSVLSEIALERNRITLGEIVMEGTFGKIYNGYLLGEDETEKTLEQKVYIKTVTDQARQDQIQTMLKESCLLKGLCHQNINPILGACLDPSCQPLLVFAQLDEGNMKKFLHRCKALSTQQLVYIAIQIIRGVQYLHRKRIIHKDIAARNCIIDHNLGIRLTDMALSRDIFPNDYHCLGDNENRPIKWLAIEALVDRKFSQASDVWSFGVTLWELMTLGQTPYADVDPFEMAAYLREGYRISQPVNCPDELFAVMACCWALSADERPKFAQLLVCLQDFYAALGRFI